MQINLVLPPMAAFHNPGDPLMLYPPVLGQQSIQWREVFSLIRQPQHLWDMWKPSRTLDQMDLDTLWACWTTGKAKLDQEDQPTGMKTAITIGRAVLQLQVALLCIGLESLAMAPRDSRVP
ncbi:hypothetical protein AZE42_08364, partial [Rhizopogon vesiculosus]